MSPFDLIRSRDGSLSPTKLAASTFHLLLAMTVAATTAARLYKFIKGELVDAPNLFDAVMWGVYSLSAIGHAVVDKTGAQVKDFKDRKLDAETPGTVTTTATVTKETSAG